MKQPSVGDGQWLGYALLTLLLRVWGALGFAAGLAWAGAPCADALTPWMLLAWY